MAQGIADKVAYRAYKIQQIDRQDRRNSYIKLGIEFDETVVLLPDIDRVQTYNVQRRNQ